MKDLIPRIQFDPFKQRLYKLSQMPGFHGCNMNICIFFLSFDKIAFNCFQISHQGSKRCFDIMGKAGHQPLICLFCLFLPDQTGLILHGNFVDSVADLTGQISAACQSATVQISGLQVIQYVFDLRDLILYTPKSGQKIENDEQRHCKEQGQDYGQLHLMPPC